MKLFWLLIFPWSVLAQQQASIIPEPAQLTPRDGFFRLDDSLRISVMVSDTSWMRVVKRFVAELTPKIGFNTPIVENDTSLNPHTIYVTKNDGLSAEGYHMDVLPSGIHVVASTPAGLFYAFQSLKQLMPPDLHSGKSSTRLPWKIPGVSIADYPRYGYRGMHLDVSRHFFPMSYLRKYIDLLAFYKINTFHWHLTDSHGWRLKIDRYPRLTSVGAWRAERGNTPFTIAAPTGKNEKAEYGGFYTKEEVKALIKYAADRFVTIIPEIEMPGHCTAALVAYPEYTCLNNPVPLRIPCGYPGDLKHNFCVGNDSTFIFLQNILDEVIELFPSEYIHIGGDEVRPASWLDCPRCAERMKNENLKTAGELQGYFTRRIGEYIHSKNKKLIGWDEILEAEIPRDATVMSWRGDKGGIAAAKDSLAVVMSPYTHTYFDFYQSPPALEPDISYAGLPIQKVYSFEPTPSELSLKQAAFIKGGQACLWTENIRTPARADYMLAPRLLALSEVLWTPAVNKDYPKFIKKLDHHFGILRARGVNFSKSVYNVSIDPIFDSASRTVSVSLNKQTADQYIIRYSLKGSTPTSSDAVYTGPIEVKNSTTIKAGLFRQGRLLGKVSSDYISIHKAAGSPVSLSASAKDTQAMKSLPRLTDGISGTIEPYDDRWVRFTDSVVSLTITLKEKSHINSISFGCLEDMVGNAMLPESFRLSFSEGDGSEFHEVYAFRNERIPQQKVRHLVKYKKQGLNAEAAMIRLDLRIPQKKNNENTSANALFLDEIIIE